MFNYFAQSSIVIAKVADSADRGIESHFRFSVGSSFSELFGQG